MSDQEAEWPAACLVAEAERQATKEPRKDEHDEKAGLSARVGVRTACFVGRDGLWIEVVNRGARVVRHEADPPWS
jgi:hypothetical protein